MFWKIIFFRTDSKKKHDNVNHIFLILVGLNQTKITYFVQRHALNPLWWLMNITLDNYGPKHVSMKKIHIPTLYIKFTFYNELIFGIV